MLTRPLYEKDYEALTYKESAELGMKELELKMEQKTSKCKNIWNLLKNKWVIRISN